LADGLPLVPAEAEEVGIAALSQGEGQAALALPAVDRALEVVRMCALLLPRHVVSLKRLLNLVENGLGDEGLVIALVLSPVECDVAEVVPVTQ
jgi:hypothetical protein